MTTHDTTRDPIRPIITRTYGTSDMALGLVEHLAGRIDEYGPDARKDRELMMRQIEAALLAAESETGESA
jgi:hypothetical protein